MLQKIKFSEMSSACLQVTAELFLLSRRRVENNKDSCIFRQEEVMRMDDP